MPVFRCLTFREVPLLLLLPLVILFGASCSGFNRAWKNAGRNELSGKGLVGRWEGEWKSEVNGHHGRLRCIVSNGGGDIYEARFHAKYRKILSFGYTVPLKSEPDVNGYRFAGEADLGALAGGNYHYDGRTEGTNFFSSYSCRYDHGIFQMKRVQAER